MDMLFTQSSDVGRSCMHRGFGSCLRRYRGTRAKSRKTFWKFEWNNWVDYSSENVF